MKVNELIKKSEQQLKDAFALADEISEYNQAKVLQAFNSHSIALRHFNGTTGYGYGDDGRVALGDVYATSFGAQAGIVSPALLSGTHALSVGLFGVLRTGDRVLCISGMPYDTIRGVIYGEGNGSLKDFGISFDVVDLNKQDKFDKIAIEQAVNRLGKDLKMVYIQRSRGYELRDAFSVAEIGEICAFLRKIGFEGCIFVDNCYGEFVEKQEPCEVGADICVGSLIKNPGGGLAPTGGYIVGKFVLGPVDIDFGHRLAVSGSDHRKFLRQVFVSVDITAPLYWWKEFDTYKVGTVANSTSTMHKIHAKAFERDDFSHDRLDEGGLALLDATVAYLEAERQKFIADKEDRQPWHNMIQMLPSSYNQMRTVTMNYENLINIYYARRNHKLAEWHTLCDWILTLPCAKEWICIKE